MHKLIKQKLRAEIVKFIQIIIKLFKKNNKVRKNVFDKKVKLYYYSGSKNFGDELNNEILKYLNVDFYTVSVDEANLIAIGSLLSPLSGIISNERSIRYFSEDYFNIWGSGFIKEKEKNEEEYFIKNANIYALRGELSKKRCEKILKHNLNSIVLGDPGLLVSRAVPMSDTIKKYDVGIIPHYVDKDINFLKNIKLVNKSFNIIDIQGDINKICKQICECKIILSSAMHGLIASDSYGIPNTWIRMSDNIVGGGYKFNDYYSIFGIKNASPIDLRNEIIDDKKIDMLIFSYSIKKKQVDDICNKLEKVLLKIIKK